MGSLTKGQREAEERIKEMIMRAKKLGRCDGEGRSIRDANGMPVAPPRGGVHRRIK